MHRGTFSAASFWGARNVCKWLIFRLMNGASFWSHRSLQIRKQAAQSRRRSSPAAAGCSLQRSAGPFAYRSRGLLCLLCAGSCKLQNNRLFTLRQNFCSGRWSCEDVCSSANLSARKPSICALYCRFVGTKGILRDP